MRAGCKADGDSRFVRLMCMNYGGKGRRQLGENGIFRRDACSRRICYEAVQCICNHNETSVTITTEYSRNKRPNHTHAELERHA